MYLKIRYEDAQTKPLAEAAESALAMGDFLAAAACLRTAALHIHRNAPHNEVTGWQGGYFMGVAATLEKRAKAS